MQQEDQLLNTLSAIKEAIELANGRGVLIGGIAVGLSIRPRATRDVDALVVVALDDPQVLWEAARTIGFELKHEDGVTTARSTRFLQTHYTPAKIDVDFQVGLLDLDYAVVDRAIDAEYKGLSLKVASPEDLIILKVIAGRSRDLYDIHTIFEHVPNLDKGFVKAKLLEVYEFLEEPEIVDDLIKRYMA